MRVKRRTHLVALALLIVGITGTASAWLESLRYVYRPAFLPNNVRVGSLGRMQYFSHGDGGSAGTLGLQVEAWNASGTARTPGNAVKGRSHVRFIKYKPGGWDFCGEKYMFDTPDWVSSYMWHPEVQPSQPPCGDGYYQVTSCSESHAYRKDVGRGETVIGHTVEDCSNILNWSFSGMWHPWCSNCDHHGP